MSLVWCSASSKANTEATTAATIPRGASAPRKMRSLRVNELPNVETNTDAGRTTSTITNNNAPPPQPNREMSLNSIRAARTTNRQEINRICKFSLNSNRWAGRD